MTAQRISGAAAVAAGDLEAGPASGDFAAVAVDIAVDVVKGAMLVAIDRMAHASVAKDYPEKITGMILRALGVPADKSERLVASALPRMAPAADSLLSRVLIRAAARSPAEA